jgi:hypothetical protein
MKNLGYDELWHQYMLVKFKDGTIKKIEKNHVVEDSNVSKKDLDNVQVHIPVNKSLTGKQLIENASLNDDSFWQYDPSKSNCQIFVRNVVDRNNLLPQIDSSKVLGTQNAQKLIDSLPGPLKDIPIVITNLASAGDKIVYGEGIDTNSYLKARLIIDGLI